MNEIDCFTIGPLFPSQSSGMRAAEHKTTKGIDIGLQQGNEMKYELI